MVTIHGIQAFPLAWPMGVPRTKHRTGSPFKTALDKARKELLLEVERIGGKLPVISSNIPFRQDGSVGTKEPGDPGVAIYFQRKGVPIVFACDRYLNARDNMQALNRTIEALRGIERWGSAEMMNIAFSGFTALNATNPGESWWTILGVEATSSLDEIEAGYKRQMKTAHPDAGGSHEAMQKLNLARDQARAVAR